MLVRYWPKADIRFCKHMSAFDPKADINVDRFELLARRQAFKGGHAVRNEMERLTFCREDRLLRAAIDQRIVQRSDLQNNRSQTRPPRDYVCATYRAKLSRYGVRLI